MARTCGMKRTRFQARSSVSTKTMLGRRGRGGRRSATLVAAWALDAWAPRGPSGRACAALGAERAPQPHSRVTAARSAIALAMQAASARARARPPAVGPLELIGAIDAHNLALAQPPSLTPARDPIYTPQPFERRAMDFQPSKRCAEFKERLQTFMDEHVYPAEPMYESQLRESGDPHPQPA